MVAWRSGKWVTRLSDNQFFKDSSVVGQNCQLEPSTAALQEIFKTWVSEIAFPVFWEDILKKSQLLKRKF